MDQEESELMMRRYLLNMAEHAKREVEKASGLIEEFSEFAGRKGVRFTPESFSYIQSIGIVATAPNLAKVLIAPIQPDKDGLVDFKDLSRAYKSNPYHAGYLSGTHYMLLAHPYYRRQMHQLANWAPRFIEVFWKFDETNVSKYIAIDENRVRINVDGTMYAEFDTWYGAQFSEDISKIPIGPVKLRPPSDLKPTHVAFFFANVYCLDIKWSVRKSIKTFQALELKTQDIVIEVDKKIYHPARYIHAEFDLESGMFRHFDGAVQLFLEDEYFMRRDSDLNFNAKNQAQIKARSKKLFKLNGALATADWVELCCHFFTANPLTFEYFTGRYPEHTIETLARISSRT